MLFITPSKSRDMVATFHKVGLNPMIPKDSAIYFTHIECSSLLPSKNKYWWDKVYCIVERRYKISIIVKIITFYKTISMNSNVEHKQK